MSYPVLRLHPGRERAVVAGHPWIFGGAIANLDAAPAPGSLVDIHAADDAFLGRGYVNPRCGIAVRVLTRRKEAIDSAFLQRRVDAALQLRQQTLQDSDAFRVLNGEGDELPGFVVDKYGAALVVQCLTAGAAQLKGLLVDALARRLEPVAIYERSSGAVRREEGLEAEEGLLFGVLPPQPLTVHESGLRFLIDICAGQKTGFFLDQRDNRRLLRELANGHRVLNAFAYTGAFSVYAAAGGAREVVSVESSPRAAELARHNWAANEPATSHEMVVEDVFEYLRATSRSFDVLVLDPPALVKRRLDVRRGLRAYKDLHLWALRRAAPGALLLTFSCSQHVSPELFRKVVHGAASDAGRSVQVLRSLGPGIDHPVLLAQPEGEYLKGLLLRAL
jgi:23S rRNA (cytosine1962-C5)-methyltransferase